MNEKSLTRREREVMDIIYQREEAAVSEVVEAMADPPSYSAVRALMNILVDKGHLKHRRDGLRYIYRPTRPRKQAAKAALQRTVQTFFEGAPEKAVAALLDMDSLALSDDQLQAIAESIEAARAKGK